MARPVNDKKRQENRERILKESVALFAEFGYSASTTVMIAKNAGVTSGTIFQYFSNKEELFRAAVLEPLTDIRKKAVACLKQEEKPTTLIKNMVEEQFNHISIYTNELRLVQYVLGQRNRFSGLTQEILQNTQEWTDTIEQVYKTGQLVGEFNTSFSPAMVSRAYISFLNGVCLTLLEGVHHPEWEGLKEHAFYLFGPIQNEE
ncbi:TetR/AcrR family transcriptional regulator [Brevibacillus brevis]|uniref:TetR/AcrR family transcriptional regulator n=1 Tax=Brevibacillus brevis TaxID=1393 RepID=UPI0007D8AC72|nr:TetR/AcrR family transcriptional regulator [Brevibacillus brevis]WGV57407.1 TetR/AcrR family transcriptional regulator [Brevibacillus brevis]